MFILKTHTPIVSYYPGLFLSLFFHAGAGEQTVISARKWVTKLTKYNLNLAGLARFKSDQKELNERIERIII